MASPGTEVSALVDSLWAAADLQVPVPVGGRGSWGSMASGWLLLENHGSSHLEIHPKFQQTSSEPCLVRAGPQLFTG